MALLLIQPPRPTVAGILVRHQEGIVQFGTHIPKKAYLKNPNTVQRSTVQGGIDKDEVAAQAMDRELTEEYGSHFARQCEVRTMDVDPMLGVGSDGTPKLYHWYLILAQEHAEPTPNQEVHMFFWDDATLWNVILRLMSKSKAAMIRKLTQFALR